MPIFKIWQHLPERSALCLRQTLWKPLSFKPQENTSEATSFFIDLDLSPLSPEPRDHPEVPLISSSSQQLLLPLDALLLLFVSAEALCLSHPQHPPGTESAQGKIDGHHHFTSEWLFSHMWNLSSSSPYRSHSSAMPGKDHSVIYPPFCSCCHRSIGLTTSYPEAQADTLPFKGNIPFDLVSESLDALLMKCMPFPWNLP